jgi:hypothetical protein
MQKEALIKELNKYNSIKNYLKLTIEVLDENNKKAIYINNNMEKCCNYMKFNDRLRKTTTTDIENLNTIMKKVDEKIKQLTTSLNQIHQ